MRGIFLLIACIICNTIFFAQKNHFQTNNYSIQFKTSEITPPDNINSLLTKRSKIPKKYSFNENYNVIIQFYDIPDKSIIEKLQNNGIFLGSYLSGNAYRAKLKENNLRAQLNDCNIRSVFGLDPEYKIDKRILDNKIPAAAQSQDYIKLLVLYSPVISKTEIKSEMNQLNIKNLTVSDHGHFFRCAIPKDQVMHLAEKAWVNFIQPGLLPFVSRNDEAKVLHRSNYIGSPLSGMRNLTGEGVKIGIWDGDLEQHPDFEGRLTIRESEEHWDESSEYGSYHGIHVAGTLAGSGLLNPDAQGMAPGAELFTWNYNFGNNELFPVEEMEICAAEDDIVITQNSYGAPYSCDDEFSYLVYDAELDNLVKQRSYLSLIYSAGNSNGECGKEYGTLTDYAKNIILVGAVDDYGEIAGFSSRGPLADGRFGPHISANGVDVFSTVYGNSYLNDFSGTSMACPGVSGVMAQLYERYNQLYSSSKPVASLMKAIICNTADDKGNPGPDYQYGFGTINALRAVKLLESKNFDVNSIKNGEKREYIIDVPKGLSQLNIMLCWSDVESDPVVSNVLVNDIDISVKNANQEWLPWVLNPAQPDILAQRGVDNLNNIEQVTIYNPQEGPYTIIVSGSSIPDGPQEFAVVYELVEPQIQLTHPCGGESFDPGQETIITWDATNNPETIDIEFSADKGHTYQFIKKHIPANQQYYKWVVPDTISGSAHIRISSKNSYSFNAQPFSILGQVQNLHIAHSDDYRIEYSLKWDTVKNAMTYEILHLNGTEIVSIKEVQDNYYTLKDLQTDAYNWYTVRALNGQNQAIGKRAQAVLVQPAIRHPAWPLLEDFTDRKTELFHFEKGYTTGCDFSYDVDTFALKFQGLLSADSDDIYAELDWDKSYEAYAKTCRFKPQTSANNLFLKIVIKQIASFETPENSKFRVLINDVPAKDMNGKNEFHADINNPEYKTLIFNISKFTEKEFYISLQALCKYGKFSLIDYPEGDAVFIKSVELYVPHKNDISIEEFINAKSQPALQSDESIEVKIRNNGSNTINRYSLSLVVNNEKIIENEISKTLAPLEEFVYRFINVDFSNEYSTYEIKATASINNDTHLDNNSKSATIFNYGPVILMPEGDSNVVTTCDTLFVDPGSTLFNYPNLFEGTLTIHPNNPDKQRIKAEFSTFGLEPADEGTGEIYDNLQIFNGASTNYPSFGTYYDTNSPGTIHSTAYDGSLTFKLHVDEFSEAEGWIAKISCADIKAKNDLILSKLVYPDGDFAKRYIRPIIEIVNAGEKPVESFDIFYQIDNQNIKHFRFNSQLNPDLIINVDFDEEIDINDINKEHQLKVWVNSNDENPSNDTLSTTFSRSYCHFDDIEYVYIDDILIDDSLISIPSDSSAFAFELYNGKTSQIKINTTSDYASDCRIWVDWDDNGTFNFNEEVNLNMNVSQFTGMFSAPANTSNGEKIIRIKTGISGEISSPCTPSLGETIDLIMNFTENPVDKDVEVTQILSPVSGLNLSANEAIHCIVTNNSRNDISQIPISLVLNSSIQINDFVPFIQANQSVEFTFNSTIDLSGSAKHELIIYTQLNGDEDLTNDSLKTVIVNAGLLNENNFVLNFDGIDNMVLTPPSESLNFEKDITFEAWIYPRSYGEDPNLGFGRIFDKGVASVYLHSDGNPAYNSNSLIFYIRTYSGTMRACSPQNSIQLNTWQHIAATYNGTEMKLFINGVEQVLLTFEGNSPGFIYFNTFDPLLIGESASGERAFDGYIDDVKVWSAARSNSEINNDMYQDISNDQDLLAYYKFASGYGSNIAFDFGPNQNPGELLNMNTDISMATDWVMPDFITEFSVGDVTQSTIIDDINKTITVIVPENADISNLTPEFELFYPAIAFVNNQIQLSGQSKHDFSSPLTYEIKSNNEIQQWMIQIKKLSLESEIESFILTKDNNSFLHDDIHGIISENTIEIVLPASSITQNLTADIIPSAGATISFKGIELINNTLQTKYSDPVMLRVTSELEDFYKNYSVIAREAYSGSAFESFTVPDQFYASKIDASLKTIEIWVPFSNNLNEIIPEFKVSQGAIAYINSTEQKTGENIVKFSDPVTYTVVAENGEKSDWIVTINAYYYYPSPFSEEFNIGIPQQYTLIDNDKNISAYGTTSWEYYPAEKMIYAISDFEEPGQADDWLILPPVRLMTEYNTLSWDVAGFSDEIVENYTIWISETGNSISDFKLKLYDGEIQSDEFEKNNISLDSFARRMVYIAFQYHSTDGMGIFLDNIMLKNYYINSKLFSFSFEKEHNPGLSETIEGKMIGHDITFTVADIESLDKLIPSFSITPGAMLSIDDVGIANGSSKIDIEEEIKVMLHLSYGLVIDSFSLYFEELEAHQLPYSENFDSGIPEDYTIYDLDNQKEEERDIFTSGGWVEYYGYATSTSYYTTFNPSDDWLITPPIKLTDNAILSWDAKAADGNYPDGYEVYISTTGNNIGDFTIKLLTVLEEDANEFRHRDIDLSAFKGEKVFIAFRNNSENQYLLYIDNISVKGEASKEASFLSFSIPNQIGESVINLNNNTVNINVDSNTQIKDIIAQFELSKGAVAYVNNYLQISGGVSNNFNEAVIYTVYAEDTTIIVDWTIIIEKQKNNEAELLDVQLNNLNGKVVIDEQTNTVLITPEPGADIAGVNVSFTVSDKAILQINGVDVKNQAIIDLTKPVTLKIISEDESTSSEWEIVPKITTEVEKCCFEEVLMYPNPAYNYINLANAQNYQCIIYTVTGRIIHTERIQSNTQKIDIEKFAKGMYYLKLSLNNIQIVRKFHKL